MNYDERSVWEGMLRLMLLLGVLISGCSGSLQQSVSRFEFLTPKPFGYVIGDEIAHRIVIDTRAGIELNNNTLPKPGELSRWLTVNQVEHWQSKTGQGMRHVIDIRYQVFYAPLEVKMLAIPGFSVQFKQGAQTIDQDVPDWHFTISPLREMAVRKDESGEYMRPDMPPGGLPNDDTVRRLFASLFVVELSAFYLTYLYGYLPGLPRRGIFKRAQRQLAHLPERDIASALSVVHHALNTLNRKPLFQHKLNEFYRNQPDYRKLAGELKDFFELSNRFFFAGYGDIGRDDFDKIERLCRLCREVERGGR
ncbi:MAG: nonribosomal peptide synthetase MxaA [Gammaproteobacteria bacterium HGW-Gammaproteobacteria-10]|nr:MAG: nonribosomal peptide synthetase MxaA [Gammaproteobacteria bacterium HGW-Gammaproteobacteria-10]